MRLCAVRIFVVMMGLVAASSVFAVDQSSTNFQNLGSTFVPALFDASSSGFQITGSIEPVTGLSTSLTYSLRHGVLLKEVVVTPPPPPPPPPPTPPSPTPTPSPAPSPTPSFGGGGGGSPAPAPSPAPVTSVIFSGRAYPNRSVTLLKDAQVAATTVAEQDAIFRIELKDLSVGTYFFSLYSEDGQANRSSLLAFPTSLTKGATTIISGIFIAPTINVDKSEVKRGENIAIFGQTTPSAEVVIMVNSDQEMFVKTSADAGGAYLYNLDTSPLEYGQHSTKSKSAMNGEVSAFSRAVGFVVGQKTTQKSPVAKAACGKADLNCDGRVNLVDFSIAAYWYKRPIRPAFQLIEKERLNGDGKVNLVDFSIMAYYWTG